MMSFQRSLAVIIVLELEIEVRLSAIPAHTIRTTAAQTVQSVLLDTFVLDGDHCCPSHAQYVFISSIIFVID